MSDNYDKIDADVLSGIVSNSLASAESWSEGDLAAQQAENLKYYYGEPFGNEKSGFSSVVTRDSLEVVEGIMPELMKIFAGTDNFVEFDPVGSEDVQAAEQATDYINHIFNKRGDGFKLLYDWFKDALLMKNGLIKVGWAKQDVVDIVNYSDVTQEELDALASDEEDVTVEAEDNGDGTFEATVTRTTERGLPNIYTIPSEEFVITARSRDVQSADFVGHLYEKSCGDLIAEGYDEDQIELAGSSNGEQDSSQVKDARFSDVDEEETGYSHNKVVKVLDCIVSVYDPETKRNKKYSVVKAGEEVLSWEEVSVTPFINLSPIMMPHKLTGVSPVDLVKDIQEMRSQMFRQIFDNNALANAGRYAAVDGQVNLQDLIDNQIGGIVREKVAGAARQLPTPQISSSTFPLLGELSTEREDRVGVSRMTQGLDPNALTSNTAATSVNQIMTAAQQKILLIARVFAETGVKELFLQLYGLARINQDSVDIVKLRGGFVPVAPFDWIDRKDMTVTVGIGNGSKDQQLYHLNNISQALGMVGNSPYGYLVTAENTYNMMAEFVHNAGYKNVDAFISNPATTPPPEPQPTPEMIAAQGEAQKDQADAQLKQAQAANYQAELLIEQEKLKIEAAQLQLDVQKFDWQKKKEAAELGLEATQKRPVAIGDNQLASNE